jgi:hypothetical protein
MKKNIGTADKALRIFLAIALVALSSTNLMGWEAFSFCLLLAGFLILTAFLGLCIFYLPFGFSSRKD